MVENVLFNASIGQFNFAGQAIMTYAIDQISRIVSKKGTGIAFELDITSITQKIKL